MGSSGARRRVLRASRFVVVGILQLEWFLIWVIQLQWLVQLQRPVIVVERKFVWFVI